MKCDLYVLLPVLDDDKHYWVGEDEARKLLDKGGAYAVTAAIIDAGASRVLDLGCGDGRLVQALLEVPQVAHVTGADVSTRVLERAADRLH